MAIQEKSNKPILKIFYHNGGTVEEEDFTRKENGKKYLVLRNKKTNKVGIHLFNCDLFFCLNQNIIVITIFI